MVRQCPSSLIPVVLILWCCGSALCLTTTPLARKDGRLVVPDIARVDNALLKEAEADKFLSLWFIHVLIDPVYTSSKPWTLLIPKNTGLEGVVGEGKRVRELLNQVILGQVIPPSPPPDLAPLTSMAGTPLVFTTDKDGTLVNGIRLTGEEYKFSDGVVYIVERALPLVVVEGSDDPPAASPLPETLTEDPLPPSSPAPAPSPTTKLPALTHRFATFKPRGKNERRRPAPAPSSNRPTSRNNRPIPAPSSNRPTPSSNRPALSSNRPDPARSSIRLAPAPSSNSPAPSSNHPALSSNSPTTTPSSNHPAPTPSSNRPAPAPSSNRPAPAPSSNRPTRPARPVLQPVLGEEPLSLAEAADSPPLPLFPAETLAGSGFGSEFDELEGSAAPPVRDDAPFLESFIAAMKEGSGTLDAAEFLYHFNIADIASKFRDTGRYTALVPIDHAFYMYYPIDWGFNPFLVTNFTKDVLLNHFVRGNINLAELPSLAELTTLGGKTIKFTKRRGKLLGNGVEVILESELSVSRGRAYSVNELMFVDNDRVFELQAQYGDLETAPLLGNPWPASQFLSHLLGWVEEEPKTSYFAEYLNQTNLAYLVPGHDENLDPMKYTAFIPTNEAISATLYSDAPDPYLADPDLRSRLVLAHLVPGRLYIDDLIDGMILTTLDNNTVTVTKSPEGIISIGEAKLVGDQTFLYNLANVFLVDHLLSITDQDVLAAVNKHSTHGLTHHTHLTHDGGKSITPAATNPEPTEPADPPTTTPTPTQPRKPTTPSLPLQPLTFPPEPPTTTTTTTPPPSTTPRIRFETRTEISISRRVNDGLLEPLDNSS